MPPIRIQTLEDFKEKIRSFSIKMIYCFLQPNPQGSPPIGMRLYFYHGEDTYFLIDCASGEKPTVTGISVRTYGRR